MSDKILIIGSIIFIILLANYIGIIYEHFNFNRKQLFFIVMKTIPERVSNINTIINENNITNYDIFSAVDGKKINRNLLFQYKMINQNVKEKHRDGVIGCALSHITLWKQNINKPYIVVLEDDIDLPKHFNVKLNNFINNIPNDYDICQIYNWSGGKSKEYQKSIKINKFVKKGYPQYGTVGYIISKKGMKKLLKKCVPIYSAIDVMISDNIKSGYLKSYVPVETLVLHKYKFNSSVCGDGLFCKPTKKN